MIPIYLKNEFEKINSKELYSKKVRNFREKAFSELLEKGLPNKRSEEWRFTDLSMINKGEFKISENQNKPKKDINIANYDFESFYTIIIYNGYFQKNLSPIPKGIKLASNFDLIKDNNWSISQPKKSFFDLLNTAFMESGLNLTVEKNTDIDRPLRILFICSGKEKLMISPRICINLEDSSSFSLIEQHVGNCDEYFYNGSIIINMGDDAKLDHVRIQNNSKKTINIANLHVQQKSDSNYSFNHFAFGSALSRINLYAYLIGKGANCDLNGLSLSSNNQHLDAHIITDHQATHCISSQNFKSILKDKSSGVFNGRSIVQNSAEKTSSSQSNKNLLLSEESFMNSNPQLEIYTDDVKCSHGSSTGALEPEALFYIRSRGIDQTSAISLLVGGFASEIIEVIENAKIKEYVTKYFDQWISENNQ